MPNENKLTENCRCENCGFIWDKSRHGYCPACGFSYTSCNCADCRDDRIGEEILWLSDSEKLRMFKDRSTLRYTSPVETAEVRKLRIKRRAKNLAILGVVAIVIVAVVMLMVYGC